MTQLSAGPLKAKALIGTLLAFIILQKWAWAGNTINIICNYDQVLYSNFWWNVHHWLKDHKMFSTYVLKIAGHAILNIFYFAAMIRFWMYGCWSEAGWCNVYFHILRNSMIRFVTYTCPMMNIEPGLDGVPGGEDDTNPSNDFYFSGHVGTCVMMLCMSIQHLSRFWQWACFGAMCFTTMNMIAHHGHFIHDMYIGAVIGFFAYKLSYELKYFWNYYLCLFWYFSVSLVTCGRLPRVALEDSIETIVENYAAKHPKLDLTKFIYTGLPEDENVETRRKKYDGVELKGTKDSVSSL